MTLSLEQLSARMRQGEDIPLSDTARIALALSIPSILEQLVVTAMEYIDAAMVGHIGAEATAAIGIVSSSTWLLHGILVGLYTAFSIQIAQYLGADRQQDARGVLRQSMLFNLILGLGAAAFGVGISRFLPGWLGADISLQADASAYFAIWSAALPFTMAMGMYSAMLRATGDALTPGLISVLVCALDVVFNFFLINPTRQIQLFGQSVTVWGAGLEVPGAALGTALSTAIGGLLALGANVWNMAFYGCCVGYFLIYRPLMRSRCFARRGERAANRLKITLASVLGCVLTLQLGAFSVVLETTLSGITDLPFGAFCAIMQPIHLAIGLIEGLITAAVLLFLYEARPELLRDVRMSGETTGKASFKGTIAVIAIAAVLVGGGLSLLASGNPDGLEWSLFGNSDAGYTQNMGLDEDSYGVQSSAADKAGTVQEKTAFLPDYSFAGSDSAAGTSVSGIAGAAIVAAAAALICGVGGICRHKKNHSQ